MKKFFSLMLVAVLLVSALPFQAFAAEECAPDAHDWVKSTATKDIVQYATCQQKKIVKATCSICGKTGEVYDGDFADHDYEDVVAKAPTCTESGVIKPTCKVCGTKGSYKYPAATGHTLNAGTVTEGANCTDAGTLLKECTVEGCDYTEESHVNALGHNYTSTVTKPATCEETGVKTFTCSRCGDSYEEEIERSTIHNYVGNACSVCGKAKDLNDTASAHGLRFINEETDEDTIVSVRPGYVIDAPAGKKVKNMKFKYWSTGRNGTGTRVYDEQSVFGTADGQISATTFYAYYVEDKNDGLSYVDIIVRRYVNGKAQGADITLFEDIEFEDGDSIYDWLYAKRDSEIATKLFERVSADEYQWKNRYFYNYWSDEVMTKADLKADGSKAILIKVESLKSNAANVKLYLHKSSTSEDPFRILDMTGYTAGNYVSRSAVADLVEKYYSYKSIGNLYNEEDWEELMNGEDNNGRSKVLVEDNGYTEIHVVVTNANTKSNSKADSSNPKTGDYITIAVGTMVLAAAAVVTLAELKKRKMI